MASLFCPPGPSLPQFSTLLIKGIYPPSAPIHLCASHLKASSHSRGRALFLTPNREVLAAALEDYGDGWMAAHCMTGAYAALFSRIDMFYPPTAKHWLLLLSLFRPLQNGAMHNIAMLPHAPSIIVLHEPSSYFLASDSQSQPAQAELTQYLQLVTAALSLSSFLSVSGEAIPVVLFDSRLQELCMPIIRPASPTRRITSEEDTHPARKEHVERFVEKYFEWVGNVSDLKDELFTSWMYISHQMPNLLEAPSAPTFHGSFDALRTRSGLYQLKLYHRIAEDTRPITWEWTESRKARRSNTGQMETHFVFHTTGS